MTSAKECCVGEKRNTPNTHAKSVRTTKASTASSDASSPERANEWRNVVIVGQKILKYAEQKLQTVLD
jgi:hypothetical protein